MSSNTFLPKPSLLGAVLWMLGAVVSLTLMALAGRELMAEISIFEIIFFRNLLCPLALALIVWPRWREILPTRRWRAHGGRNVVHFFPDHETHPVLSFLGHPSSRADAISGRPVSRP